MSKTPVSELNARMSLDISALEQAVPKAESLLERIHRAQQEAMSPKAGGTAATSEEQAVLSRAERVAAQRIERIKKQQEQVIEQSKFDLANPFQQQVMASQRLNALLQQRNNLTKGSVEYETAHLAVLKQAAQVEAMRANLTAGSESFTRLGNTAADSQKGFARMGLAMQQAGYQVQDFAVQVTSGTNAMVAFSQQSSQLLGFFGGWKGAVAGAAISAGILIYRLWEMRDAAKASKEQIDAQIRSLEELGKLRMASRDVGLNDAERRRDAVERFNIAKADFETQKKFVEELQDKRNELLNPDTKPTGRGAARDLVIALAKIEKELPNAKTQLEAFEKAMLEAEPAFREAQKFTTSESEAQAAMAAAFQVNSLRERIELGNVAFLLDEAAKKERKKEADAIRDTLDPMRERVRQQERINELVSKGALLQQEADRYMMRLRDERERQLKLPSAMQLSTGSSVAGLRNTDGTAQQLITIQQQMLSALRTLVFQGAN